LSSFMISCFLLWSCNVLLTVVVRSSISALVIPALSCSVSDQVSPPYSGAGTAAVLYMRNLVCFWGLEGFIT
jgi:hypothetical protein